MPCGALGLSADVEARMLAAVEADYEDTGGVGGTLAGNALSLAAMRATLGSVLTDDAWEHTIPLAARFADGVRAAIGALPWNVTQLGCRAEYRFQAAPARNGTEAHAASDPDLERYLHLLRAQPRRPAHAVPQHGADGADDHRGRRRPPHRGLRGGGQQLGALMIGRSSVLSEQQPLERSRAPRPSSMPPW